jgi:hypothetical protein
MEGRESFRENRRSNGASAASKQPNNRMNPTGPIGPRCIRGSAFADGLVVKWVLFGPARGVMRVPLCGIPKKGRLR